MMHSHHDNIYCNFPSIQTYAPRKAKIRALIMGHTGNGKTYFINRACSKNYPTKKDIGSVTREIVYEDITYFPDSMFRIYDTPGTDSLRKATEHAYVLRASLTNLPLNLVLIQAKFDSRFQKTLSEFKEQIRIFKGYQKMVVFMISHLDIVQQQEKEEVIQRLGEVIQQYGFKSKIMLYSNLNSDFQVLCKILYELGQKNEPIKVVIDDLKFYKFFNISSPIKGSLKTDEIQQLIDQVEQKANIFVNFFDGLSKNSKDINNVISQGKFFMKYYLKNLQDRQYEVYSTTLKESQTTDLYLMLSQFIQSKLEEVDSLVDRKIQKLFYEDKYQEEFNPRDMFKECPRCSLIWMKVQGCDGSTFCGSRPSVYDYYKNKQTLNYTFEIQENSVKYTKNQRKQKIDEKNSSFYQYQLPTGRGGFGVGCGNKLIWNQLPRLQNIDRILRDMYAVANHEEIKPEMQRLTKTHQNWKRQLDQTLKRTKNTIEKDLSSKTPKQTKNTIEKDLSSESKCSIF